MSGAHWGRYSDLRPTEIEAIRGERPIAYVPWGALEWHSHHAPIGLDSVKAQGICEALAARTGGVVLPAIPMGVNTIKPYKGFPHSIDISGDLASRVAEAFCLQLAEEGFRLIVLFTGHYPPEQLSALQAGADRARVGLTGVRIRVWADNMFLGDAFEADHAGATETSFQMFFVPGSIVVADLPDRPVTLDEDGITGEDPRMASAERGERQLAKVLSEASARVEKILRKMEGEQ